MDLKEHDLVLSTLSTITDKQRRCYRMIGGVLIEHTVGEVVPALQGNREQIHNVIESFKQKTEEKAKELTNYKQKYDIHFSHEKPTQQSADNNNDSGTTKKDPQDSGVLVEKET
jgi:prefoldin subunit 2